MCGGEGGGVGGGKKKEEQQQEQKKGRGPNIFRSPNPFSPSLWYPSLIAYYS